MADLEDGESTEVKGSAAKPYVLKNVGGVYSCTCPAWRNQSIAIEARTCKHLRKLRGDAAEKERLAAAPNATGTPELPSTPKAKKAGPPLLLAQNWDNATDLSDWWMSEKLDGVRAYWNGETFLSRQGNQFHAPDWFVEGLPGTPLDGELWIDRRKFQRTVSIVRRQDRSDHWKEVRFLVFDAPEQTGQFEERLEFLQDCLRSGEHEYATVLEHQRCEGLRHLKEELARIESLGGEGLMMREPASEYQAGRSMSLLKIKNFQDAEAVVMDHQAGKGRHKGRLGALVVQLADGTQFSVGTGFSDAQRESPPPIGSTITFRYQELSDGGVPRFPSFVRVHSSGTTPATGTKPKAKKAKSRSTASKTSQTPASSSSSSSSGGSSRYFEFVDGKSQKFWEITVSDTEVTVRYGRIGAKGTTKTKSFDTTDAANQHAAKLVGEKSGKGYEEQ